MMPSGNVVSVVRASLSINQLGAISSVFYPVAVVFSFVFGYCLYFRDNRMTPVTQS